MFYNVLFLVSYAICSPLDISFDVFGPLLGCVACLLCFRLHILTCILNWAGCLVEVGLQFISCFVEGAPRISLSKEKRDKKQGLQGESKWNLAWASHDWDSKITALFLMNSCLGSAFDEEYCKLVLTARLSASPRTLLAVPLASLSKFRLAFSTWLPAFSAFLCASRDALSAASLVSSDFPDTKLLTSCAAPCTLSLAPDAVSVNLSAADCAAPLMLSVTLSSARTTKGERTVCDRLTKLVLAAWLTFKRRPPRLQEAVELSLALVLLCLDTVNTGADPTTTLLDCTAKALTVAMLSSSCDERTTGGNNNCRNYNKYDFRLSSRNV